MRAVITLCFSRISLVMCLNLKLCQILVKRDGSSAVDKGMADPEFWGVMLVKPMLYGIMIPILYGLCKKLGKFAGVM